MQEEILPLPDESFQMPGVRTWPKLGVLLYTIKKIYLDAFPGTQRLLSPVLVFHCSAPAILCHEVCVVPSKNTLKTHWEKSLGHLSF